MGLEKEMVSVYPTCCFEFEIEKMFHPSLAFIVFITFCTYFTLYFLFFASIFMCYHHLRDLTFLFFFFYIFIAIFFFFFFNKYFYFSFLDKDN